jgi:predicted NBD/HSP70 family sugar kinase
MKPFTYNPNNTQPTIPYPVLEPFQPAVLVAHAYLDDIKASGEAIPLLLAMLRPQGSISRFETLACTATPLWRERSQRHLERLVKFLLWAHGAEKLVIGGSPALAAFIRAVYSPEGARKFDYNFMTRVYNTPFEVISCGLDEVPSPTQSGKLLGHHLDGCRIGFDLGASDVKVSAVMDGKVVFSTELEWHPCEQSDPGYHKAFIREALKLASAHLPKVDAIGGSAAGVYINNQPRIASLFRSVPESEYTHVHTLFDELTAEFSVPLVVINDGEVSALAGAMSLEDTGVLGLALGSSEAVGYINPQGNLTDYLDELAFAPIDVRSDAPPDEWSGDLGVGANYLSQQAVFRLAKMVGIPLPDKLSPAGRLEYIQGLLEQGHPGAQQIWQTIGVYLGYALAHYADFYDFKHVLLLGRVTSLSGGQILLGQASKVLYEQFPELEEKISLHLPDEKTRRVEQAIAAASLPVIER